MKRCYSCFKFYDNEAEVCPHCGTAEISAPLKENYLRPGSILKDRYIIGKTIDAGGFGIIYKAFDSKHETMLAIKEFYPAEIAKRAIGTDSVIVPQKNRDEYEYRMDRFLAEARTMAKYSSHKSIVNVYDHFEENNTAYFTMEFLNGMNLKDYLASIGGGLDLDFALMIINEIGTALLSLHQDGIIHRDISPDNIFICNGAELKIKLLDLGAAVLPGRQDDVVDLVFKNGYAPAEQYVAGGNIGPWSDVYALGATFYEMLTGIVPDDSNERKKKDSLRPVSELVPGLSENVANSIMKALAVNVHMRFSSIAEFLDGVNGDVHVRDPRAEEKIRRIKRIAGIAAASIVVLVIAVIVGKRYNKKREVQVLEKAELSVWYCADPGSDEDLAMQEVLRLFSESYPDISFDYKSIPEASYAKEIEEAANRDELPSLFESTDIPEEKLENAREVYGILDSPQADECMFLDQYDNVYSEHKKVPLGIVIPMACVITNGSVSVDFTGDYFQSVSQLGSKDIVAADDSYTFLTLRNFGKDPWLDKSEFMNPQGNTAAVLLSNTMEVNEIRETLIYYQKSFIYPKTEKVFCSFTYEFSLGKGNEAQDKAADRLLSWMLGNVYQNTLMISRASDGQIPVNKRSYLDKCEAKVLNGLSNEEIYKSFVMINE